VLITAQQEVVDPAEVLGDIDERDALGRIHRHAGTDRLGAIEDVGQRRHPARLHLDQAERDVRRRGPDGVGDLRLGDLADGRAPLLRQQQREQDRRELVDRDDDLVARSQVRRDDAHPDRQLRQQGDALRHRPDQARERDPRAFSGAIPVADPLRRSRLPHVKRAMHRGDRRVGWQPVRGRIEVGDARTR